MAAKDLITIAKYGTVPEANLLKAILEEQGIAAYLVGSQASDLNMGTALGGVQLQVEVHDEDKALQLLDELDEAPTTNAWQCPRCESQVDAGFEVCWSCGLTLEQARTETAESAAAEPVLIPVTDDELPPEVEDADFAEPQAEPDPQAADRLASRALRTAVFSMAFPPLLAYALYLLAQLWDHELGDAAKWKYHATIGIIMLALLFWGGLFLGL